MDYRRIPTHHAKSSSQKRMSSREADDCIRTAGRESGLGEGWFGRSDTMVLNESASRWAFTLDYGLSIGRSSPLMVAGAGNGSLRAARGRGSGPRRGSRWLGVWAGLAPFRG